MFFSQVTFFVNHFYLDETKVIFCWVCSSKWVRYINRLQGTLIIIPLKKRYTWASCRLMSLTPVRPMPGVLDWSRHLHVQFLPTELNPIHNITYLPRNHSDFVSGLESLEQLLSWIQQCILQTVLLDAWPIFRQLLSNIRDSLSIRGDDHMI